ncbi:MAG: carbohydrate ABC transporter permease [Paucibacter sp.]|nr:carbohydrate ABC transporter permease [Roseateles sp.]
MRQNLTPTRRHLLAAAALGLGPLNAARMDGDGISELGISWHVPLPPLQPALGTLDLFTFIGSLNNFLQPRIVLRSANQGALPPALRSLQSSVNTEWGELTAGSAIAPLLPPIVLALSSRQLITRLSTGTVK